MLYINVSDKYVHTSKDPKVHITTVRAGVAAHKTARLPYLDSDRNILAASRAPSLSCLLNCIWKHNERMTEVSARTAKLLHHCFHPLAFSFSTYHFLLLCDWETMTTSERRGWSYIKEAERFEPTLVWLAPSLRAPPILFFFFFFLSKFLFCFLSGQGLLMPFWSIPSEESVFHKVEA